MHNQRKKEAKNLKNQMGLAPDPDELLEGMSAFLAEVGITSSFIDPNELKKRGDAPQPWQYLTRAVLNPLSFEHNIFQQNLSTQIEITNQEKEEKRKIEARKRKRSTKMQL